MPRDAPGRGGAGLVEVEERIAGLELISARLSARFEALLDLNHVDPADFDLGPGAGAGVLKRDGAGAAGAAGAAGGGRPVTAEAAGAAVRGLAKTKDTARARGHAHTVHCALRLGSNEARAIACSSEAAQALVGLVAKRLVIFEYTEIYNASRTMSKRDEDQANVC